MTSAKFSGMFCHDGWLAHCSSLALQHGVSNVLLYPDGDDQFGRYAPFCGCRDLVNGLVFLLVVSHPPLISERYFLESFKHFANSNF